jgi:TRAF3-interacting protein 1
VLGGAGLSSGTGTEAGEGVGRTMNEQLAEAIRATQDELSGLFTRPKLTEKLLSKPPFRFLHDLVSAVTQSTGFLEGLYGVEELDSASIKDKAGKMAYLDKLIACVGICEGGAIDVRSAKIVAGLDPENTNALLAAMGRCSKSSELDWPEAVKRALAGESPGERRPPMKRRPSRAEAKDIEEKGEEEEVKRTPHLEDAPQSASDPAAPYGRRLSSRGGTRSGRGASEMPPQGLGLDENTAAQLGKDLGADIEACDGSMELTRSMLEKLITRPKLADKLLGKPPFRFLHDIITEITLATGFATGLFADQPALLDSANVKDKVRGLLDDACLVCKLADFPPFPGHKNFIPGAHCGSRGPSTQHNCRHSPSQGRRRTGARVHEPLPPASGACGN